MTPRPRQAALAERPVRHIGRMGITETAKRPGDYYWNGRAQRWETVPAPQAMLKARPV